jgi:hypothetical protein
MNLYLEKLMLCLFIVCTSGAVFAQNTQSQIREAISQAGGPESFLKEMAKQGAQSLPKMINANVEVQSVSALNRNITYVNRLIKVEKSTVRDINALKNSNINYFSCSSPVLGLLIKEYGVTVSYMAVARGSEYLFQFDLNKATCSGR